MTAAGYGIILVPRYILQKHHEVSSLRILETDCDPIELCAVWLKDNKSRVVRQYLEILREHLGRTQD